MGGGVLGCAARRVEILARRQRGASRGRSGTAVREVEGDEKIFSASSHGPLSASQWTASRPPRRVSLNVENRRSMSESLDARESLAVREKRQRPRWQQFVPSLSTVVEPGEETAIMRVAAVCAVPEANQRVGQLLTSASSSNCLIAA
jgi:hypothetical protein